MESGTNGVATIIGNSRQNLGNLGCWGVCPRAVLPMPVSAPIKVLVWTDTMVFPALGSEHAAALRLTPLNIATPLRSSRAGGRDLNSFAIWSSLQRRPFDLRKVRTPGFIWPCRRRDK